MATQSLSQSSENFHQFQIDSTSCRHERVLSALSGYLVRTQGEMNDAADLQLRMLSMEVLFTGKALIGLLKNQYQDKQDRTRLASQRISQIRESDGFELCPHTGMSESRLMVKDEYPFHRQI